MSTNITIFFKSESGHRVSLEGPLDDYRKILERGGKLGFIPEERPTKGWRFPLAQHDGFNWSLLGARPSQKTDTESGQIVDGVWWGGDFYTRRDLQENSKKKMEEAIKYSRGAKPWETGPEVEGDDSSNFKYVTLLVFRGSGKRRDWWSLGKSKPAEQAEQALEDHPQIARQNQPATTSPVTSLQLEHLGLVFRAAGLTPANGQEKTRDLEAKQRSFLAHLLGVKVVNAVKALESTAVGRVLSKLGSYTSETDYQPDTQAVAKARGIWQESGKGFESLGK